MDYFVPSPQHKSTPKPNTMSRPKKFSKVHDTDVHENPLVLTRKDASDLHARLRTLVRDIEAVMTKNGDFLEDGSVVRLAPLIPPDIMQDLDALNKSKFAVMLHFLQETMPGVNGSSLLGIYLGLKTVMDRLQLFLERSQ